MPKAQCGPGEQTESGLQGQTTPAERFSSRAARAYNCNLELVGQLAGEGASWALTTIDNCGYFTTNGGADQKHPGTVVVDASDRRRPRATTYLASPAMLSPLETLDAHAGRKLLAAFEVIYGARPEKAPVFDLYDATDCRQPVLKASLPVPGFLAHAGNFAPDGRTFYVTSGTYGRAASSADGFVAIDVADPSRPRMLYRWSAPADVPPHDIAFSEDGTRAYIGLGGGADTVRKNNGLAVLDISDIQRRRPNPQVRVLGKLLWEDGGVGQVPIPVTVNGRRYVHFSDFASNRGMGADAARAACAQGLPPFGFVRLVEVSDEQHPKVVSKIMLQVHDPANCGQVLVDPAAQRAGYSTMRCISDNPANATLLACPWKESGVRVFDIRNPARPVEIAYYKPQGRGKDARPGSGLSAAWAFGSGDRTADWVMQVQRFDLKRDEIWFISEDNGFQIVRFTDQFRRARRDIFENR